MTTFSSTHISSVHMCSTTREDHVLYHTSPQRIVSRRIESLSGPLYSFSVKLHSCFYWMEAIGFERCVPFRKWGLLLGVQAALLARCTAWHGGNLFAATEALMQSIHANKMSSFVCHDVDVISVVRSLMGFRAIFMKDRRVSFFAALVGNIIVDMI